MKLKEAQHALGLEDDIREYTQEWSKELIAKLHDTALQAKNHQLYINKDFYLVMVKRPTKMGMAQTFIWARRSCPTPVYRQDVWKYRHISGELEYLWTIPDKHKYQDILKNKQKYYENKETRRLCQFVVLMESGELLDWVKKENGELPDAVIQFTNKDVN